MLATRHCRRDVLVRLTDFLALQGDFGEELYMIASGVAEAVEKINGRTITLQFLMEKDTFLCESVLCKVSAG